MIRMLINTANCMRQVTDYLSSSRRNPPYHQRALLHLCDGKPILNFSRRVLTGSSESPRAPGIPPITEAQAEALDAVHFSALKHSLELDLKAGDMCFINNLVIMRSRQNFVDDGDSKRYHLRLLLNYPEKGWRIPEGLRLP
jgi:Taurine catabolism dioxygenase TauD, TfdA family